MNSSSLSLSDHDSAWSARFTGREIVGVEDLREAVPGARLVVTQLSATPCRGALDHAIFDDMTLTLGRFTGELRLRGVMGGAAVVLVMVLDQTPGPADLEPIEGGPTEWGHDTQAGDLLLLPPGGEREARCLGGTFYAAITAPLAVLKDRASAFDGLAEDRHWSDCARLRPRRDLSLHYELKTRLEVLAWEASLLTPQAQASLRNGVVDCFLTALADGARREPRRQGWVNSARILRQVEDYLDQSPGRGGVAIPDLCQALAVSRRTLNRAFEEGLGVGPRTYLRLRALSAARKALVAGREAGASVTQVALEHGFWELGRFSVTYRAMFGESPSQTLRGR
jgi:AraC-like DNA-binding protein